MVPKNNTSQQNSPSDYGKGFSKKDREGGCKNVRLWNEDASLQKLYYNLLEDFS